MVMWAVWVLVIILVALIVLANIRVRERQNHEEPIRILNRRYARGEITREQYQALKEDIEIPPPKPPEPPQNGRDRPSP